MAGIFSPIIALDCDETPQLNMDGSLADGQRRLLDRLGQGRMGMAGACDIFRRGAEFHRHRGFRDHVAASKPTMCTPSTRSVLASARIFTKPSVCWFALARPLARERKLADVVGDAGLLSSSSDFPTEATSG